MAAVILREALADRERLGIIQMLETAGAGVPLAGLRICPAGEEQAETPLSPTLLILPPQELGGAGHPDSYRAADALFRGNIRCAAVAEAREMPPFLRQFSERTGTTVFSSRFDPWLLKSRLMALFAEKSDRRVNLHGVLVRVSGIGVLLTGESGIGKTACGLELTASGGGWVADDAVVLEARGNVLYGRGHERTKSLIALRGRRICRVERLLGPEALHDATSVQLIVRLQRGCPGDDRTGSRIQRSVRDIIGVSLPCWCVAAEDDPRRMAGQVREIVREFLASGKGSEVRADS